MVDSKRPAQMSKAAARDAAWFRDRVARRRAQQAPAPSRRLLTSSSLHNVKAMPEAKGFWPHRFGLRVAAPGLTRARQSMNYGAAESYGGVDARPAPARRSARAALRWAGVLSLASVGFLGGGAPARRGGAGRAVSPTPAAAGGPTPRPSSVFDNMADRTPPPTIYPHPTKAPTTRTPKPSISAAPVAVAAPMPTPAAPGESGSSGRARRRRASRRLRCRRGRRACRPHRRA